MEHEFALAWVHVGVVLLAALGPGLESHLCLSIVNSLSFSFLTGTSLGKPKYQTHWVIMKIKMIRIQIDLPCMVSGTECSGILHSCYSACPKSPQREVSSTWRIYCCLDLAFSLVGLGWFPVCLEDHLFLGKIPFPQPTRLTRAWLGCPHHREGPAHPPLRLWCEQGEGAGSRS